MDQNELSELLKFSSPYRILVIRWDGRLVEVYCPFKVRLKEETGDLGELGDLKELWVWKVLLSTTGKTVYVISGKPYYYFHFDIMV